MGFYYTDDRPPKRPSKWERIIPGWLRTFWENASETFMMIRVVMGIILPVLGVIVGFIVGMGLLVSLMGQCAGS